MSNSSLVNYTCWSPNCNVRQLPITGIAIHHMAGDLDVVTCGNVFANPYAQASANYGVASDGTIGQYVDEGYQAWTTSDWYTDNRCATIEVANDQCYGDWHVSDTALEATINLCVDICQRNGIPWLYFTGDPSGNLVMHRWFAATACPGDYLASQFPYIADEVNRRLTQTDGWISDAYGWWFKNSDGTYLNSGWEVIDNHWCYFGEDGYAYQSKWLKGDDGHYYYFDASCYMKTGWVVVDGEWYFLNKESDSNAPMGALRAGFLKDGGYDYYLREDSEDYPLGSMAFGWFMVGDKWYFARPYNDGQPTGSLVSGWVYEGRSWFYFNSKTHAMQTGYFYENGYTYYFKENGYMATGWTEIDGDEYYFNTDYNCQPYGSMLKNHKVVEDGKNYYLGEDGKLLK